MTFTMEQLASLTPHDREEVLEFEDHLRAVARARTTPERIAAIVAWCEQEPDYRWGYLGYTPAEAELLRQRVREEAVDGLR